MRKYSPDGSPGRGRYRYGRSRSPKYSRYRDGQSDERYGRHRDREKSSRLHPLEAERTKWVKFRMDVDKMESELVKDLKFHEKNPEKHPMYPEEWKKFWNRRYKELQADGKDPSKHDFKPEWIDFWNKRMKEMHEEEFKTKKEELRLKHGLPKEEEIQPSRTARKKRPGQDVDVIVLSPPPGNEEDVVKKDVTVTDIKNTWKALTGSDIKDTTKRSPSPWEDAENFSKFSRGSPSNKRIQRGVGFVSRGRGRGGRTYGRMFYNADEQDGPGVVTVLRLLTAMESQLGSLGPRVNSLLATALSLEKASPNSSSTLLANSDNFVLLETVKEKLKGQLFAGIVERNMVMATKSCIQNLAELLARAEDSNSNPKLPLTAAAVAPLTDPLSSVVPPKQSGVEPVVVPGIGTMDKLAIAQQIAAALVAQGKTDVTQDELEQLINAVVGMAQASAGSEHPISTASFVSQMKVKQEGTGGKVTANALQDNSPLQKLLSVVTTGSANTSSAIGVNSIAKLNDSSVNALELLQSAYNEPKISPHIDAASGLYLNKSDNMEGLSEEDLRTLLQNFKDLSSEEQQGLITYLKKLETKDPERVEKLRQFVNLDGSAVQNSYQSKNSLKVSGTLNTRSDEQLGRLSPFSLRKGGINPSQELDAAFSEKYNEDKKKMDDSDDDYSFEDIYAAANQKVQEREKAKAEEEKLKQLSSSVKINEEKNDTIKKKSDDPTVILKETKEMIANLMGQLPAKFIQKQNASPGPRKDSPAVQLLHGNVTANLQNDFCDRVNPTLPAPEAGHKIQALGSETSKMTRPVQAVPTLDYSRRVYPNYGKRDSLYDSQCGGQQSYPASTQNFVGSNQQPFPGQQSGYADCRYNQNSGYYESNANQQYPQHEYSTAYPQPGPDSGGWSSYPDQYGQHSYQTQPVSGPYSQFPNQPPPYY